MRSSSTHRNPSLEFQIWIFWAIYSTVLYRTKWQLSQLRTYLGLVNFYHRFILGCARILNAMLSTTHGRASALLWDDTTTAAFTQIKQAFATATLLAHPNQDALTSIMTDASDSAVGAVLQQFGSILGHKTLSIFPGRPQFSFPLVKLETWIL